MQTLTRRGLSAGLLAATVPFPVTVSSHSEPDPILALIEAHRDALDAERLASRACNRAERRGDPGLAARRGERDRLKGLARAVALAPSITSLSMPRSTSG